ncbi:MAG: RuvX/YqgF family protein, partial [Gammaproteobacteria bacterium]
MLDSLRTNSLRENHYYLPDHLYLGFDFGARRTGVAVGQALTGSANPLTTLTTRNGKPDWPAIGALIDEWRPSAL